MFKQKYISREQNPNVIWYLRVVSKLILNNDMTKA